MRNLLGVLFLSALLAPGGCGSPKAAPETARVGARVTDLAGKWRLVRVAGKAPAELEIPIKSQEVTVATDGTWKSRIEFTLPGLRVPDTFDADGKLADPDPRVRLKSGRMVVESDFFMPAKPKGTPDGPNEYER
jgi:hypothetical protein